MIAAAAVEKWKSPAREISKRSGNLLLVFSMQRLFPIIGLSDTAFKMRGPCRLVTLI